MKIKSFIFSLTLIITILSCNQKNGYEIDCNQAKKQAQNDFKYKNYTWTIFSGLGYDFLGQKEFIKLLDENNIKVDSVAVSCISLPNDKYNDCGKAEMNRLIEEKFGTKFIDSLKYKSKQQFVKNHPEEIFGYEQCDMISRIPEADYDSQFEKIRQLYFSKYPLPKNYISKKGQDFISESSSKFILTKDGNILDLSVETKLENKKNNIFEKQFNDQIKAFVLNTKWIPGQINGINVDSYMIVDISYY